MSDALITLKIKIVFFHCFERERKREMGFIAMFKKYVLSYVRGMGLLHCQKDVILLHFHYTVRDMGFNALPRDDKTMIYLLPDSYSLYNLI